MSDLAKFDYDNKQVYHKDGKKELRKVSIKNGKGNKTVTMYKGGKKTWSKTKKLKKSEVMKIKAREFIPGLFKDCKNKTCKRQ
jgi:hypothetical protein